MVAGVFSYLGPQMLGLLRDWSGGFVAGLVLHHWRRGCDAFVGARAVELFFASSAHGACWCIAGAVARARLAFPQAQPRWIEPGKGGTLPAELQFDDSLGRLGVVNASGPVNTTGHPFFEPLGVNGRACVTCHQPAYAMTISVGRDSRAMERNPRQGPAVCGGGRLQLSRSSPGQGKLPFAAAESRADPVGDSLAARKSEAGVFD